jgi:hypothetical protein
MNTARNPTFEELPRGGRETADETIARVEHWLWGVADVEGFESMDTDWVIWHGRPDYSHS